MKKDVIHAYLPRQHMLSSHYEIYHYLDKTIRNVELHHHDFYELYYFISGNVQYMIEGKIYRLLPGDLVLINTKELHQVKINQSDINYERIVLWIDKAFLKGFSSESFDITECFEGADKQTVIHTGFEVQRDLLSILNKIIDLQEFNGVGGEILGKAYIMELVVKINNLTKNKGELYPIDTKKSELIDRMIEYIEENISEDINIDILSEKFYLSKYHLIRKFKKYTGVTVHRYIMLKRLILAKEYILQDENITEICMKCGFGNYSNFLRAFKNEYGITTKQFQKMMIREL